MKVLNIGNNLISKKISKFSSKDSITITDISNLELIDNNNIPDIIFINLDTKMELNGFRRY